MQDLQNTGRASRHRESVNQAPDFETRAALKNTQGDKWDNKTRGLHREFYLWINLISFFIV